MTEMGDTESKIILELTTISALNKDYKQDIGNLI